MVSLENEYFNWKQMRENAEKDIAKMEDLDVENMTQDQLEARNRVIKMSKEQIEEAEEMLEEIKEELVEFINNGGEVSEKTKEEINYFEPIMVDFKIVSNRNPEVYTEGYVKINDAKAEDVDWYYWNGSGYDSYQIIWHDGVEITGATYEQGSEMDEFENDLSDEIDWTTDVILQSDEDKNRTYVRENVTLIINDGAKFEVDYEDYNSKEWDSDYYMAFTPKLNGEKIIFNSNAIFTNPYTWEDFNVVDDIFYENGAYIVEIPKCWWEDGYDDEIRREIIDNYENAFRYTFAMQLVLDAKIGDKYGDVLEQALDDETDDEWLFKFYNAIKNDTVGELIENEGFEIP